MSFATNREITALKKAQHERTTQQHELSKRIEYLYLQMEVCNDKILLYEQKNDTFKNWYWGDLYERIEGLIYEARTERDTLNTIWHKEQNVLIDLMNEEIKRGFASIGVTY